MKSHKVIRLKDQFSKKAKIKRFFKNLILFILVIAVFTGIGYVVMSTISNLNSSDRNENQSSLSEETSQESQPQSSQTESDTNNSNISSSDESSDQNEQNTSYNACYMPNNICTSSDDEIIQFLSEAKSKGYDSVIFTVKDEQGNLLYNSENTLAQQYKVISSPAFDINNIVKLIHDNELNAIAKMSTLKDAKASHVSNKNSYAYGNTEYNWLDNSPDLGGKSWLNPYMDNTKKYLSELASEVALSGADVILLYDMEFPTQYTSEINYINEYCTKPEVLKDLQNEISNSVKQTQTIVIPVFDAFDVYKEKQYLDLKFGAYPNEIPGLENYAFYIDTTKLNDNKSLIPKDLKNITETEKLTEEIFSDIASKDIDGNVYKITTDSNTFDLSLQK